MENRKFANNATTTLAVALSNTSTQLSVAAGTGSLFPSIAVAGDEHFSCTLVSATQLEIVQVVTRIADVFTIVRGTEGTTAQTFAAGDRIELRLTTQALTEFLTKEDEQETSRKTIVNDLTFLQRGLNPELSQENTAKIYFDTSRKMLLLSEHGSEYRPLFGHFVGEIKKMAFKPNPMPDGWFECNGQSLSRTEYANLFALIGTQYGNDDSDTFKVPDYRRRVDIGQGGSQETGSPGTTIGETGGAEISVLAVQNLPAHAHSVSVNQAAGHKHSAGAIQAASGGQHSHTSHDMRTNQTGVHKHSMSGTMGAHAGHAHNMGSLKTNNSTSHKHALRNEPDRADRRSVFHIEPAGAHQHGNSGNHQHGSAGGHAHSSAGNHQQGSAGGHTHANENIQHNHGVSGIVNAVSNHNHLVVSTTRSSIE